MNTSPMATSNSSRGSGLSSHSNISNNNNNTSTDPIPFITSSIANIINSLYSNSNSTTSAITTTTTSTTTTTTINTIHNNHDHHAKAVDIRGSGSGGGGGGGGSDGVGSVLDGTFFKDQAPNTTLCIRTDQMLDIVHQYTNQMFWFPAPTVIILVICYCLIVFLGILGNLLIIIVVARRRDLRSSKNLYILNLSICDVIMSAICMPFSLAKLTLKKWTLGAAMCRIVPALATVDVFVSTFTIVAIATDRYLSIMHARQMKRSLVLTMLLVIWIVSILLSTPLFCFHTIETQELYNHVVVKQCIDNWPDDLFREVYTTTVMLFQYLTPSAVISLLHARICNFLRDRHDDRPGCDTQIAAKAKADMKRHRKNMVLLTAMSLIFSITWLPLTVLNIIADLDHEAFKEKQYNLLHAVSLLIAMSSSAINPIMYGWYNSNIRRAFCDLVRLSGADSKVSEERDCIRRPPATSTHRSGRGEKRSRTDKERGDDCNDYISENVLRHSVNYNSCPGQIFNPVNPSSPVVAAAAAGATGSLAGFSVSSRERVNTIGRTPSIPRNTKMVRAVIEKTYFTDNKSFCSEEPSPSDKANDSLNGKKETDSLRCSDKGECAVSYDSIAMTCD